MPSTIAILLLLLASPALFAAELTVVLRSNAGIAANAFVFVRQDGVLRSTISDAEGRASFRLDAAGPVDVAAFSAAHGWAFTLVAKTDVVIELSEPPAGLLITRADTSAPLEIWSPHGFPIHQALAIIGTPMQRDVPLYLRLPEGEYRVVGGDGRRWWRWERPCATCHSEPRRRRRTPRRRSEHRVSAGGPSPSTGLRTPCWNPMLAP